MGRRGERGYGGGGGEEIVYLSVHCQHQNGFCIKMGREMRAILMFQQEVMDKATRQCPKNQLGPDTLFGDYGGPF